MKIHALFLILLILSSPAFAKEECKLRDYSYESGVYLLEFYKWDELTEDERIQSATMYPFKITNQKENLVFKGIMGYGNGYSYPQISIDLCGHKSDEYRQEHQRQCHYEGTVYEIDGIKTNFGFSEGEARNPILFPKLQLKFYYSRNGVLNEYPLMEIPGDIWTNRGCQQ